MNLLIVKIKKLMFKIVFLLASVTANLSFAGENLPIKVAAFGDSLTSGYGLRAENSFPYVLEQELKADGYNVIVANKGVSGETTQDGLARLSSIIAEKPDVVILEFGANDVLRGYSTEIIYENLAEIILSLQSEGITVILTGIYAPPKLSARYAQDIKELYQTLSSKYQIKLYPFFLDGIVTDLMGVANPDLILRDGLHPNEEGIKIIANNIKPLVKEILDKFIKD
ncbi:MAG: arylesterase [Alphaproteobacteria bacterium]